MVTKAKDRYSEDLFQESTMTFGEHLEELRTCLWRAIVGLGVGVLVGLYFASDIVQLIQTPLTQALEKFYLNRSIVRLEKQIDDLKAKGIEVPFDKTRVEAMAARERLAFESMYLDGRDLLDQYVQYYPESFNTGHIPRNSASHPLSRLGPNEVVASEFPLPIEAAKKFVAADQAEASTAMRSAFSRLSLEDQKAIRKIAETKAESLPADPEKAETERLKLAESLAGSLDRLLLTRPVFWNEPGFSDLPRTKEVRDMLARGEKRELDDAETRRLNRMALESAFPEILPATRRELVRVMFWRPVEELDRVRPTALSVSETFGIWMKAALVLGAVLSAPWVFIQIWNFVAAGLYPHEKRYMYIYMPFSIGLFVLGAALAALFVFEPVLTFLFSYNASLGIDPDPRIAEWMGFVLILPLGFGVSFQLPLVMLFMERIGIFSVAAYMSNWRISVMVIAIVSMILTPADPYSMMLMAAPLSALYFLGIGLCKFMPRGNLFSHWDEEPQPAR